MNRLQNQTKKKQKTLFQTWRSTPGTGSKLPKKTNLCEEIDLTDDLTEEELLAIDKSVAEYDATNIPGPSTSKSVTALEFLPGFDNEAGETWIYPTNFPIRQYQYTIVENALFKNTMVILPTGLGKTFIAAVVMYNYFRWYPRGKIIFLAPTKPLVAQQIEACYNIMGIPLSETAEMTGATAVEKRRKTWEEKRVFFMTPQAVNNDLSRGICPAKDVKLLVFDEAHKATKCYAYCQLLNEIVHYSLQFRVLALSATPGNDLETVKQVFQNLLISHVELRTDESPDIQPYTFKRNVENIVVPLNEEFKKVSNDILSVLEVYVNRLKQKHVYTYYNLESIKQFHLVSCRNKFCDTMKSRMSKSEACLVEASFAMATTVCHAYEMMVIYGLRTFYNFVIGKFDESGKGSAGKKNELLRNVTLSNIMDDLRLKIEGDEEFLSHPKLPILEKVVREHFLNFESEEGEQPNTRVMIFSAYRSSVDEITNMLNKNRPLIRAMSFTGQANAKNSKGITQKEQIQIVKQFRSGGYNTLVATCVGEEGLDIGSIDLIICFDAYKSPIRLVQRMGRTGRKREGRVVMLTTEGREDKVYDKSKAQANTIHKFVSKANLQSLYAQNPRMVPKGLNPRCHKMHMSVPTYQRTIGRKKKNSDEPAENIMKFLKRYTGTSFDDESPKSDGNDDKQKRGSGKLLTEKKPCRLNKKIKEALIIDDDSDDVQFGLFYADKDSETDELEEIGLDFNEPQLESVAVEERLNPQIVDESVDSDTIPLQETETPSKIIIDHNNLIKGANEFFSIKNNAGNISRDIECNKIENRIKSPPPFDCIFKDYQSQLSPVDFNLILQEISDENFDRQETNSKLCNILKSTNIDLNKQLINPPAESLGFDLSDFNDDFLSPVKSQNTLDLPNSPIITSMGPINRIEYFEAQHDRSPTISILKNITGNSGTYSVTQLVDMVHEDSMRIVGVTHPRLRNEESINESEKSPPFTMVKERLDEKIKLVNSPKSTASELVPNFDLKLNFSFDDNSEDNVIPSSQNDTVKNDVIPAVSFDLNLQDSDDDDKRCYFSSLKEYNADKRKTLLAKTSTPICVKSKHGKTSGESDSDWEEFPPVKIVRPSSNQRITKLSRKRRLSSEFLLTEAQVTGDYESSDESETGLDIIESSFIDDNPLAGQSMTAVYLKSVKDHNVGPKRFKLNHLKDLSEEDMTQFTQEDDYEQNSFCVANDQVEFEETQHKDDDDKIGRNKKWKRIVKRDDSSTSVNDESGLFVQPSIADTNLESLNKTKENDDQLKEVVSTKTTTLCTSDGIRPTVEDHSHSQLTLLVDSREINGSQKLVSELRHRHKVQIHVTGLQTCDFIVSTRMGVERKLISDFSSTVNKTRVIERISTMMILFDRTCLIIEANREKPGVKARPTPTVYYDRLLSAIIQLPVKVIHSDSQEHTALLLKDLISQEKAKGFALPNDYKFPLSKKEQELCRLYQKIPKVNYVIALNLCRTTTSVQQLVNSSASVIQRKGKISDSRADDIANFVKHNFNSSR